MLDSLQEMPARHPRAAAQGKARFLAEARSIQETVSRSPFRRLSNWIATIPFFGFRKERSPMMTAISSIVLALAIMLGGGGITAYAAQDSLPDETLYPVKLFLEDTRYSLTTDPNAQVDILTSFANNRVDEIAALFAQGGLVPEAVMANLQTNLQLMLHLAAGMDEESATPALQHIRENLRTQEQLMTMLGQPDDIEPAMEQLRAMLQEQHRLAQLGLDTPLQFRQMYGQNKGETDETLESSTDTTESQDNQSQTEPQGNQNHDCVEPGDDCVPAGNQSGNGGAGNGDPQGNPDTGGQGSESGNTGGNPEEGQGGNGTGGNDSGSGNDNGGDPGSGDNGGGSGGGDNGGGSGGGNNGGGGNGGG
jgi:hypothetical protein